MADVRQAAVSGLFYPDDARDLHRMVESFLAEATPKGGVPKAIIVPHAGYIYSGAVAGAVLSRISSSSQTAPNIYSFNIPYIFLVHAISCESGTIHHIFSSWSRSRK